MQAFREGPLTNTFFKKRYTYQHKMASLKLQWPLTNRFWKRNNIKIGVSLATSRMPNQISLVCECVDSAWQSTTSVCDARSFQIERERPLKYSSYLLSSNCCIPCERPSFLLSSLPRFQFCVPDVSIYPCQKLCSQTKKIDPFRNTCALWQCKGKMLLTSYLQRQQRKIQQTIAHTCKVLLALLYKETHWCYKLDSIQNYMYTKYVPPWKNIFCFVSFK